MSEPKRERRKARDGAFVWRPEGTWGIGEQADEPEVLLVDADPGSSGPGHRRAEMSRTAGRRIQQRRSMVEDHGFDRFTLSLSASLAKARQKCEDEGRQFEGTLVIEVRGGRHPLRRP